MKLNTANYTSKTDSRKSDFCLRTGQILPNYNARELCQYLSGIRLILGNLSNSVSFAASLLARRDSPVQAQRGYAEVRRRRGSGGVLFRPRVPRLRIQLSVPKTPRINPERLKATSSVGQ